MSSGTFTIAKYQADSGEIHPIRVQPETLLLNVGSVNAQATGTLSSDISVRARKGKREFGIGARTVSFRFTAAPPTDYAANQTYTMPILTAAVWDAAVKGTTGTYLSTAIQVAGKSRESVK